MKEAMFSAPLGDDVFKDDPTVNLLEQKASGKRAPPVRQVFGVLETLTLN